eukprot:2789943-Rhodomonas_salina.2
MADGMTLTTSARALVTAGVSCSPFLEPTSPSSASSRCTRRRSCATGTGRSRSWPTAFAMQRRVDHRIATRVDPPPLPTVLATAA